MIVPNKAISYEASLLSKLPLVLQILSMKQMSPTRLHQETQDKFEDISQFLLAMDTLFILEKVEFIDGDLKIC